jgi:hypothetical protein
MNLTILMLIIGVGILYGIYQLQDYYKVWRDSPGPMMVAIIPLLIIGSLIHHYVWEPKTEEYKEHLHWVKSLGNDKYLEGSFTLGSGTIGEVDYYFYYMETSSGYKRLKVRVSNTYLVETDSRPPEIVEDKEYVNDSDMFLKHMNNDRVKYKVMYVPKGTIIRDFKVR